MTVWEVPWSRILDLEGSLRSEVGLGEAVCTGRQKRGSEREMSRERAQSWLIHPENSSSVIRTGSED